MIAIAENMRELADSIVYLRTNCNAKDYPTEFQSYDEAWQELRSSLDHLRAKIGEMRYHQLVDMVEQAKSHYDAEPKDQNEGFLASWLMQDIEQIVKGKVPFAYPEELFRWPR